MMMRRGPSAENGTARENRREKARTSYRSQIALASQWHQWYPTGC